MTQHNWKNGTAGGDTVVPKLEPQSIESLSDLVVSFSSGEHAGKSYPRDVLVMRCQGTYGFGSAGNSDATYLMAMGKAALEAFDPEALIIDMTDLHYEWGDMLECVLGLGDDRVPMGVVVGHGCRQAVGTLCFGENSTRDACEKEWILDSLDQAWAYVTSLLDEGETPPLHEASKDGDLHRMRDLIEAGSDVNREDADGNRPLHEATDAKATRILIEAGADVIARNRAGVTPLHLAESVEIARILIKAGADPDARTHYGASPLSYASSPELAKFLVNAGADVQLRARKSLLHSVKNPQIAQVFIEAGAHVNAVDENGKTPLDSATDNETIFSRQAENVWGSTADIKAARNYSKIAALLRRHGGRTSQDIQGQERDT